MAKDRLCGGFYEGGPPYEGVHFTYGVEGGGTYYCAHCDFKTRFKKRDCAGCDKGFACDERLSRFVAGLSCFKKAALGAYVGIMMHYASKHQHLLHGAKVTSV